MRSALSEKKLRLLKMAFGVMILSLTCLVAFVASAQTSNLPPEDTSQATTTETAAPDESTALGNAADLTRNQLQVSERNDFVIGPGKHEVSLAPGESTTRLIRVTNRRREPVTFELDIEDFVGSNEANETVTLLGNQQGPRSLSDFLNPALSGEFTLEFGEQIEIPVTISIPENAEAGGRYGAVIVSNAPTQQNKETGGATIVSRLASLFLVRVEGDIAESGQLNDFKLSGPSSVFFSADQPTGFEIQFENDGNVHLAPYGQIEIKNIFGQLVDTLPIDAYFALPESTRYRQIGYEHGFLLGRYTAELNLNRSYGNERVDTATLSFWVIPWKALALTLLIVLVLVGIVRWFASRFELRRRE